MSLARRGLDPVFILNVDVLFIISFCALTLIF